MKPKPNEVFFTKSGGETHILIPNKLQVRLSYDPSGELKKIRFSAPCCISRSGGMGLTSDGIALYCNHCNTSFELPGVRLHHHSVARPKSIHENSHATVEELPLWLAAAGVEMDPLELVIWASELLARAQALTESSKTKTSWHGRLGG